MGDYFDDDDLINDYMEEDFEPPPEYDDEFVDEEVGMTGPVDKNTEEEQMDVDPPKEGARANDTNEQGEPAAVHDTIPQRKMDVFSFERYQGAWRAKAAAPINESTAKEWKRLGYEKASLWEETKAQLLNPGRSLKARAPDAQLVEFGDRQRVRDAKYTVYDSAGMSLRPVEGDESVSMTVGDGTRVHVRATKIEATLEAEASGPILGVTMTELFRRSDSILREAERQKQSKFLRYEKDVAADGDDGEESVVVVEEKPVDEVERKTTKHDPDSHLWVDKHAPSAFSHLLSDDRTNREVLRALRAWDPYVFHREAPRRPTFVQHMQQATEAKKASQEKDKFAKAVDKPSNDIRPDESNRVILLSGPPGIGKTTLAHIISRHAGYRPMEVNASDERSESVLKERIIRAMESTTLNVQRGKEDNMAGRPNCLILDEIDGADAKSAITSIVDIIRAEMPQLGSKDGRNKLYLRRPIIFICNHKYAPALRPLLPYARQFDVAPPSPIRLVARLRAVLSEEGLSVFGDRSLLNQLVSGTGGDVRSCLYSLQFAAARAREIARMKEAEKSSPKGILSLVDISSSLEAGLGITGAKDARNDLSVTVTAVFRKTKEKLGHSVFSRVQNNRVERVLQLVEIYGNNSKLLDCLFTNLLQVSYVDPTIDRCALAHEWLSSTDTFGTNKTMPAAAAAIHLLCRVETKLGLTFSNRRMMDAHYQREANVNLTEKFVEGLTPNARGAGHGTVALETVPYSLWMLSAGHGSFSLNRAVSSLGILSKSEREAFNSHVSTLRSLGLTYVANEEGSLKLHNEKSGPVTMRLEPQIDRLIHFEELSVPPENRRKQVPSVLKELLAHSALIEEMRAKENQTAKQTSADSASKTGKKLLGQVEAATDEALKDSNDTNVDAAPSPKQKMGTSEAAPPAKRPKIASANFLGLGAAKAKAVRTARKAALIGFDKSTTLKVSNSGSNVPFHHVIRFKYQQGFTQAVRTPCRIEDVA